MFSIFKNKNPDKIWKTKAKKRHEEIKKLNKKIKELTSSRNKWKTKAIKFKNAKNKIEEELKKNF